MKRGFYSDNKQKLVLNKKAIAILAMNNNQMKGIIGGNANYGTLPSDPGITTSKGEPCTTDETRPFIEF